MVRQTAHTLATMPAYQTKSLGLCAHPEATFTSTWNSHVAVSGTLIVRTPSSSLLITWPSHLLGRRDSVEVRACDQRQARGQPDRQDPDSQLVSDRRFVLAGKTRHGRLF